MKAALVFVVLAAAVAVWWFFLRRRPVDAPNQHVTPELAPPHAGPTTKQKLEGLSTAGCQVAGKIAGISPGPLCKYTPFNLALEHSGQIKTAGKAIAGAPVAAAKTVARAATSVYSSTIGKIF